MYNLFIVHSPLQFLGALEAREHFKTKNNLLIVKFSRVDSNNEQLMQLLELFPWDESMILDYAHQGSRWLENTKIIKQLKKRTYDYIFFGAFEVFNQLVGANLKHNKIFMLDEGTITILIHKYKFRWKKQLQDRFFKHIRYNILGLKTAIESKVNYFTMFDLKPHDNELVVKNNFNFLKQNYFTKLEVDNDHLYLLGMVEGLIDEDHYVSYVEQVIADHPDKKILYLPHRREIMSKKLQALFGDKLSLFQPDAPVELDFMMRGIYPMHIVSLFSTALFTLKQIYSNAEIEAYVIADDDLLADVQDTKDVYSLLEKNGVICVALKKHK